MLYLQVTDFWVQSQNQTTGKRFLDKINEFPTCWCDIQTSDFMFQSCLAKMNTKQSVLSLATQENKGKKLLGF